MREIKFRAWNKLANKMAFIDMLDFMLDSYRATAGRSSGSGHLADIELMQFTGLKDCKGKMIYESDIVTCEGFGGRYKVVYEGCAFVGKHIESDMTSPVDLEMQTLEIIGNIYENPELLEATA